MTIGCAEASERIVPWVAGEIEPDEGRALEEHLSACRSCSAEAERMRRTLDLIASDDVPDPGPVYWSSFGARLSARIEDARRRARLRVSAAVAAAAIVVAVLAIAQMRRGQAPEMSGSVPRVARNGSGEPRHFSVEESEARLREALQRAMAEGQSTREIESILDEIAPADPFEEPDGPGDLSPEDDRRLTEDPADSRG
jgi:anti-sigma factor RsiW